MSDRKTKESAASAREERFFKSADLVLKAVAALIGVAIAVIGHRYQQSLTASQLLTQRESGDTQIRAEMFKAITDRLIRPPKEGDVPPEQDALLAGLLALNFHEHIELKPLMVDLDDRLERSGTPESKVRKDALRSIARRVRGRQTAMLVDAKPAGGHALQGREAQKAGRVTYFSVTREGKRGLRCSVPAQAGMSGCLRELMSDDLPDGNRTMYLSVDEADWERERFQVSLGVGKRIEIDAETLASSTEAADCRDAPPSSKKGEEIEPDVSAYNQTFVITWFDFPLTDNTLLADGTRYSVFIDEVCRDEEDEPQAVRLGMLYFPKDYFASRERPTNYRQLRDKLGLNVDD